MGSLSPVNPYLSSLSLIRGRAKVGHASHFPQSPRYTMCRISRRRGCKGPHLTAATRRHIPEAVEAHRIHFSLLLSPATCLHLYSYPTGACESQLNKTKHSTVPPQTMHVATVTNNYVMLSLPFSSGSNLLQMSQKWLLCICGHINYL